MRLFIAIELPGDLKRELGRLRIDIPEARRVPVEQIHLTLVFLGEVGEAAMERLIEALGRIRMAEFRLCFSGTGCFPDRRRPRVLWVGLESNPRLLHLAVRVREAVLGCGIPLEERTFFPHITLYRLKPAAPLTCDAFHDQGSKLKLPLLRVGAFTLFQSRLSPQGAVHIPIRNFPLAVDGDSGGH